MIKDQIRPIVLGIVRNQKGSFLFDSMEDTKKNLSFLRPIGGGIEFGESYKDALVREFKEEINAEIANCNLIKVFENIFEYEGNKGHEITFLFDVELKDKSLYEKETVEIKEGSEVRVARWYTKTELENATILPPQIKDICLKIEREFKP